MKKKIIFVYGCDLSLNSGEGVLSQQFINIIKKKLNKNNNTKFIIYSYKNVKKMKINLNFHEKYFSPIFGIFKIWIHHLKGQQTVYTNFLPLWNSLVFIFLPKSTILGPITGSDIVKGTNILDSFTRKYIFPLLYHLNILIIYKKWKKIIFSTQILKSYIPKKNIKNTLFNFQLHRLQNNHSNLKKKKFDFFIYYRNHQNKFDTETINFIKYLSKYFSVYIFGDKLRYKTIKNLGFLNRKEIKYYFLNSQMTVSSSENIMNNFNIECINNNLKILTNKKLSLDRIKFENFIQLNYLNLMRNESEFKKKIINIKKVRIKKNNLKLKKLKLNISQFFDSFFEKHKTNKQFSISK